MVIESEFDSLPDRLRVLLWAMGPAFTTPNGRIRHRNLGGLAVFFSPLFSSVFFSCIASVRTLHGSDLFFNILYSHLEVVRV